MGEVGPVTNIARTTGVEVGLVITSSVTIVDNGQGWQEGTKRGMPTTWLLISFAVRTFSS